jgi:hypothetical protein
VVSRFVTPQSCLAFTSLSQSRADVSENGFRKRSVVAWRRRLLRFVAFACGQRPREVLLGAFKKSRRVAWTDPFKRRSGLLARTRNSQPEFKFLRDSCLREARLREASSREASLREASMASKKSAWRPLSAVVSDVLRDVRVISPAGAAGKAVQTSN